MSVGETGIAKALKRKDAEAVGWAAGIAGWLGGALLANAQLDPYPGSLVQLGCDQSLSGRGPQSLYAYYYYNDPEYLRTNVALRLAVAPVYVDSEIGFRSLLPRPDIGLGINGGGFGCGSHALRDGGEGAQSVGVLYQYNFAQRKVRSARAAPAGHDE